MPVKSTAEDQHRKLFIGGLSYTTTDDALKEYYSQWGEVVDCIVMKEPQTKRSRGFGFVSYSEKSMVDECMNNRPHVIDGKTVEPKRAVPREFGNKAENQVTVKKLYVSGIKEDHEENMLREYFSEYGAVEDVDIIVDKGTGKKRGFAFVVFDDYDSVDKCIQKSHTINGKRCDVKKALSREEMKKIEQTDRDRGERFGRSGRGGGARGGGGGQWGAAAHGWGSQWGGQGGWGGGGGGYGGGWGQGSAEWNQGAGVAAGGWGAQQFGADSSGYYNRYSAGQQGYGDAAGGYGAQEWNQPTASSSAYGYGGRGGGAGGWVGARRGGGGGGGYAANF